MILYEDYTIIIALEPENSLLSVEWLANDTAVMFEFQNSFHQILKIIDENSIKRLFIDCSTAVKAMPAEPFRMMSEFLIGGIASCTKLEKLARIEMINPEFEVFTLKTIAAFREIVGFTFEERAFHSKEEALTWLKAG
jgi:hypothetical protein